MLTKSLMIHLMDCSLKFCSINKEMTAASELKDRTLELKNRDQWSDEDYQVLSRLRLRYFTPREIANFLCFPATYSMFIQCLSPMSVYRVSVCKYIVNIMYFNTKRNSFHCNCRFSSRLISYSAIQNTW